MLNFLKPSFHTGSIYELDFEDACRKGLRGVILDIDNTLVPHDAPADEKSRLLVQRLKQLGIKPIILSNNHEPRAKSFAEAVGLPFICEAGKPSKKGYLEAVKRLGLPADQVVCIGDQLLTDIWGANNAGIKSVLTEPLDPSTDTAWIKVKRVLEHPVKWCLHKVPITSTIL